MALSIAEQILDEIEDRLDEISLPKGYQTDAGLHVYTDRSQIDSATDTLPALMIYDQEEVGVLITNRRYRNRLEIRVVGLQQGTDTRALIADIKKAILQTDHTLGGLCHALLFDGWERVDPDDWSGLDAVEARFSAEYDENYGDPYTQI